MKNGTKTKTEKINISRYSLGEGYMQNMDKKHLYQLFISNNIDY